MSRIGKQPVQVLNGVTITVSNENVLTVKGPKGELKQTIDRDIKVEVKVANMVKGVTDGYTKKLELVGVGYKASNQGNLLDLSLGYSHNIIFEIPKELKVTTAQEKGDNPKITLEGIDKQLLGQVAAKLRSLRKPEPYKGKGVKYVGEQVRRKAGKAAGK